MSPPFPPTDEPVDKVRSPDAPAVVLAPVFTTTLPLTPELPPSADASVTAPLFVAVPTPDTMLTDPPFAVAPKPAAMDTSPPAPAVLE